jgi:hypothetical protein
MKHRLLLVVVMHAVLLNGCGAIVERTFSRGSAAGDDLNAVPNSEGRLEYIGSREPLQRDTRLYGISAHTSLVAPDIPTQSGLAGVLVYSGKGLLPALEISGPNGLAWRWIGKDHLGFDIINNSVGIPGLVKAVVDHGIDTQGILSWGRWTIRSEQPYDPSFPYNCCTSDKSLHYVFGVATPNAYIQAQTGTATFNLIGATSPTLSNGASAPGTLTSGVVNVAWGTVGPNPAIGVNLAGTINGNAFTVTSNLGGIASPSSGITYNAATQSFKSPAAMIDGSSVSGFFAGPNATHVGLSYSKPVTGGTVQGAAAFKRP